MDIQIVLNVLGVIISSGILLVTIYRWIYLPQSEKKKKRRKKKSNRLRMQKASFEECKHHTKKNQESVENDDFSSFVGPVSSSFKLFNEVKLYQETFNTLSDWLTACKNAIAITLKDKAKENIPTTLKDSSEILILLQNEHITARFLNAEKVTKRWIEETYPSFFQTLMDNLKESERSLDRFFIGINKAFKEHEILRRFRKEKENFLKQGEALIKDCDQEIKALDKELSKFKDLED